MNGHDLFWYLVVGLITGWLAGLLVQGRGMGIIRDMIVGIVGAVIGGFFAQELGIKIGGFFSALAMSVLGAALFLMVLRTAFFSKVRRR